MSVSRTRSYRLHLAALLLGVSGAVSLVPADARAQWATTYEQFYLPGSFNWQFRHNYPAADRLFNAFDFGHAILYETLWTKFGRSVPELEQKWYDELTKEILVHPPRVPLEEAAIEVAYAKLAPEAKMMFDWAHLFHRQVYDVWADERIPAAGKDAKVAELIRYYKSRPDIAFSSRPKTMALMQEQPYSLAFRKGYPKFNGLIWGYHWLQVGLYEPLVTGRNVDEKQAGVRAAVTRFWQMLQDAPRTMPHVMPMTAAVAPEFSKRYPEASIIFDNLHSMHDVVSDILANPDVPRNRKRAEILLAARRYRDDTSFVMTEQAWRTMAMHMGQENMGGPAVGFLTALPTPTVTYGAVMTHDERTGEMTGFSYGQATGGEHGGHAMAGATPRDSVARDTTAKPPMSQGHQMPDSTRSQSGGQSMSMDQMMALQMRLLSDTGIRRHLMADTATVRMMRDLIGTMPAEHREHMEELMREAMRPPAPPTLAKPPAPPTSKPAARKPAPAKPATAKPATAKPATAKPATAKPATAKPATAKPATAKPATAKPATAKPAKPADPMAGHKMPPPKPPAKKPPAT